MGEFIIRIIVGVFIMVSVAVILKLFNVPDFHSGIWSATFGNIAQTLTGDYIKERKHNR